MTPTAKSVLISLADQANDDGYCWPAVGTIAERTCLSERAVQNAIVWLEVNGYLSREMKAGRATRYTLTPAAGAPPQEMHPRTTCTPTPAPPAGAPAPRAPITVSNRKLNQDRAVARRGSRKHSLPDGFGISDRVRQWATEKKFDRLEEHLEHFLGYARAFDRQYVDWDQALMNAIRADWAGLRKVNGKFGGTVIAHPSAASPDEAILRRISLQNDGMAVTRLQDGRLRCGVRYYKPNGVEEMSV